MNGLTPSDRGRISRKSAELFNSGERSVPSGRKPKSVVRRNTMNEQADWEAVLDELVADGLTEKVPGKDNEYRLTELGIIMQSKTDNAIN